MIRKKHALTLLEVVIAVALLGFLLTALFDMFYQGLKHNISAKELKQQTLRLELFHQKMKTLLAAQQGVWIDEYPQAEGLALFFKYEEKADPDFEMCGQMQGILFLSVTKELNLAIWSEEGKARREVLLDRVDALHCHLFDAKKKNWHSGKGKKEGGNPIMVKIGLGQGDKLPYVFFLNSSNEKISYPGGL